MEKDNGESGEHDGRGEMAGFILAGVTNVENLIEQGVSAIETQQTQIILLHQHVDRVPILVQQQSMGRGRVKINRQRGDDTTYGTTVLGNRVSRGGDHLNLIVSHPFELLQNITEEHEEVDIVLETQNNNTDTGSPNPARGRSVVSS